MSQPPSRAEWVQHDTPFLAGLAGRMLHHYECLRADRMGESDNGGTAVDRYTHGLQAASRAERDGRDPEYVLCALLHDIGDVLGPHHHAEVSATLLAPYLSERRLWMVRHHADLQRHTFVEQDGRTEHFLGIDPRAIARFAGHPYLNDTLEFCRLYDQPSYEPGYDARPLAHFRPLLEELLVAPTDTWSSAR